MCLEYILWMSEKYMMVALPQCGEDRENTGNCWIGWDRCLVDIDSLTIWQLEEEKKLFSDGGDHRPDHKEGQGEET